MLIRPGAVNRPSFADKLDQLDGPCQLSRQGPLFHVHHSPARKKNPADDLCHCARACLSLQCKCVRHEQHFRKDAAGKPEDIRRFSPLQMQNCTYQILFLPNHEETKTMQLPGIGILRLDWLSLR